MNPAAPPDRINPPWLADPAFGAVADALVRAGGQVHAVGGCVRDFLAGRPVGDVDIATDLHPEQVVQAAQAAGLKPVPTGIDHGTVTVVAGGKGFEVTTWRRDVATDGRRATVAFGTSLAEDAARRDFTINAIYCDLQGRLFDPFGGRADLAAGRVRFVGDPARRIAEDYLRILRFFRFIAWFGKPEARIDPDGLAACAEGAEGLAILSRERITAELAKLLSAPDPAPALGAMQATGVLARLLPGADARAIGPLVALEASGGHAPDWLRRLAALGVDPATAGERLRLSRRDARRLEAIARALAHPGGPAELGHRFGAEAARDALLIRAAREGVPLAAGTMDEVARGAAARFPVRAADLMPQFQGPALGRRLEELRERWIASDFRASREELLAGD